MPEFCFSKLEVKHNDPPCDNDCQTDNETIDITIKYLEDELRNAVMQGQDKVVNVKRFRKKEEADYHNEERKLLSTAKSKEYNSIQ